MLDNLDELKTFTAVVDARGMSAAARLLGVSNKAVSRRVAQLEHRAGVRLLQRTTRKLAITDEGRALYARCRRILAELDEAERELGADDALRGSVALSISPEMTLPFLIDALRDMLAANAELRVQLRTSIRYVEPIQAGLDLVVHAGAPRQSTLIAILLGSPSWVLCAAPRYLDRRGRPRRPEDLVRHECLRALPDQRETHWALTRGGNRARRFPITGRFETDDARAMSEALYAGIGIGPRPEGEVAAAERAGRLERVLPRWRWAPVPLYALVPPGRQRVARVRALIELLRGVVGQLA